MSIPPLYCMTQPKKVLLGTSLAPVLPIPASCPPFRHFTPEQQKSVGHEYDEVRDCMLGWDIPDYGLGGVSFRIHSGE